jgi:glycosyltransferase involved in cell wall biosynthesis
MSKIKVLVVPSDRTGVGYFRSTKPHIALEEKYPDEFHVDIEYEPELNNDEWLKQYDVIHYHRTLGAYEQQESLLNKLDSLGIVTIMDLDDYWSPGQHHPAFLLIKNSGLDKMILNNIRIAKNVTTTTSIFADEIKKFNKNVVILPNAINPNESQFNQPNEESNRIRIGWLGGSSHLHDLKLLEGFVSKNSDLKDKVQYVLCGFDTRGTVTEINQQTGERRQRAIKPEETVWARYEEIFTNKYSIIDERYKKFLMEFREDENLDVTDQGYRRVWTKPVTTYAMNYSKFDISLAPIKDHIFNRVKSQLKVIEAGFYKKALIASEVGPYTIDLKHSLKNGVFGDGNALLVSENRNHSDWAKYIKKLVYNPNLVVDLGERLYETVKDTYDLKNVTKTRQSFYKSIIK